MSSNIPAVDQWSQEESMPGSGVFRGIGMPSFGSILVAGWEYHRKPDGTGDRRQTDKGQ